MPSVEQPRRLDYATPEKPLWPIMAISLTVGVLLVAFAVLVLWVLCKLASS
jgi:hypothetical protein